MKPTERQIFEAAESFEALKFFPAGSASAKEVVMKLLDKMVATQEQLAWLMDMQINRVGVWEGPAQVRALFCTRFRPVDGTEGEICTLPGFTPAECEAAFYERQAAETDRMLAAAKNEQKLLGPPEPLMLTVPVKQIGAPKLSRIEQELRDKAVKERLANAASAAGQPFADTKPMVVHATPKRTPEQAEKLMRDTESELERRRLARGGKTA